MQLKAYQERTLRQIEAYAKQARQMRGPKMAFYSLTDKPYQPAPGMPAVPYVCIQIPTGGGKTLVASHAVGRIFSHYLQRDAGLVMWLVPWDNILTQTLAALRDRQHPYRQVLDTAFPNGVKVVTLREALFGALRPDDLDDNLCIVVASLPAFRVEDREGRKVYESNGYLMSHFSNLPPEMATRVERDENGVIVQSLANVIRLHAPMLVLDEGHNAQTTLSFDTLARLNPSFMLEYTATPKSQSNILVNVPAYDLKQESMVKLPIWLLNRTDWRAALRDARAKRDDLEKDAQQEARSGDNIRPILLLQAESRSSADPEHVTVERIKSFLLDELHIPAEQIAKKTGEEDELAGVNLFAPRCPIRYIITVYALKEGWDCSFAYVLASVANLNSRQAVEQIIGRVLRLPYARRKRTESLNYAYVYTVSQHFHQAAEAVRQGLIGNGYTPDDVRAYPDDRPPSVRVGRVFQDDNAAIPRLAVLNGNNIWRPLGWGHLIGDFDLTVQNPRLSFTLPDEERSAVIDIDKEGDATTAPGQQLALSLQFREKPFSASELVQWLDQRLRNHALAQRAKRVYFEKVIEYLIADKGQEYLKELTHHRFHLLEELTEEIGSFMETHARNKLLSYKGEGKLSTDGEAPFVLPQEIDLPDPHRDTFGKHFFQRVDQMNDEETALAEKIDALPNLLWWYRNRESLDFYLQGWWGRFYPDFLAKTNSGVYVALEYKGEHLATAEDAKRKEELGGIWQELSGAHSRFWMVTAQNLDKTLDELKHL